MKKILFIENANFINFYSILFNKFKKVEKIIILNNSKIPFYYNLLKKKLIIYNYDFKYFRSDENECILSIINRKDLFWFYKKISENIIMDNLDIKNYIMKSIVDDYNVNYNSITYNLINFYKIKYFCKINDYNYENILFIIENKPWIKYYKLKNQKIELKIIRKFYFEILITFFKHNLKKYIKNFFKFKSIKKNKNNIFKLYYEGLGEFNLKKNGENSDLFFYIYSKFKKEYLISNYNNEFEKLKLLENNILIISNKINSNNKIFSKQQNKKIKNLNSLENNLIKNNIDNFYINKNYWLNFFDSNNIKVYLTWYKYRNTHIPIKSALNEINGVLCFWDRSFEISPCPQLQTFADVYFKSSSLMNKYELDNGSNVKYFINCGLVRSYGDKIIQHKAQDLRNNHFDNNVKKILGLFDQNSIDKYSHDFINKVYSSLLSKIIRSNDLGLIIKPKKSKTIYKRLYNETKDLLKLAIQKKKMLHFYFIRALSI